MMRLIRSGDFYTVGTVWLASVSSTACTKSKQAEKSSDPVQQSQPVSPIPTTTSPATPTENVQLFRYTISSLAGENVLCQDFVSRTQLNDLDLQTIVNTFAGRQAGIPTELPNPFTLQTLALKLQPQACKGVSSLISDGHCAVTLSQLMATGQVTLETEQRILWKDLPILAQAIAAKTSLDNKASIISGKNSLFSALQQQITQQELLLKILQGAGNDSKLFQDAQQLLEQLQEQSESIADELTGLESEMKPLQDELEKRLDELRVSRASLKQICNVQSLGAAGASWKDN